MTSAELRKRLEEAQKARKKAEDREKNLKAKLKEAEMQERQKKLDDVFVFIEDIVGKKLEDEDIAKLKTFLRTNASAIKNYVNPEKAFQESRY